MYTYIYILNYFMSVGPALMVLPWVVGWKNLQSPLIRHATFDCVYIYIYIYIYTLAYRLYIIYKC